MWVTDDTCKSILTSLWKSKENLSMDPHLNSVTQLADYYSNKMFLSSLRDDITLSKREERKNVSWVET